MAVTHKRTAEIVGAGIAGLSTAIALAQRGWQVCVHERALILRDHGAGIYLWENGIRVLEALGAQHALEECHRAYARETRDEHNRVTHSIRWNPSSPLRLATVTRDRLHRALVQTALATGAKVRTGSEVVSADPRGGLTLSDGTNILADLVVVADGAHSHVRDGLTLVKSHRVLPDGAIRLMVSRSEEEAQSEQGQKYIEWFNGSRRIVYTPCGGNEVYIALVARDSDLVAKTIPVRKGEWKESFPYLSELIDRIEGQGRWDRFEVVRLKTWFKGRVAIVGDAAHAQPPNLGQGGACAMMMGLALAVHLGERHDIEAALQSWEKAERPLIEHTQRVSWIYGVVATWPSVPRSMTFRLMGRSKWMMAQRLRTAAHHPTGTS
jgi:2-polyprenyl-6-methoxyphenol hydroxylase-like FAD-dependent oxidoreductase